MATSAPFRLAPPEAPNLAAYGADYHKYVQAYEQYAHLLDRVNGGRLPASAVGVATNLARETVGLQPVFKSSSFVSLPAKVGKGMTALEEDFAIAEAAASGRYSPTRNFDMPSPVPRRPTPPLVRMSSAVLPEPEAVTAPSSPEPGPQLVTLDPVDALVDKLDVEVRTVNGHYCQVLNLPVVPATGSPYVSTKYAVNEAAVLIGREMASAFVLAHRMDSVAFNHWIGDLRVIVKHLQAQGTQVVWRFPNCKDYVTAT